MKFLLALLLSVVALVSAAAIDPDYDLIQREVDTATANNDTEILDYGLSDGSRKLEFVVDGVYDGSLIVTEDGEVKAFDAEGNEIDIDAEDDDIAKRSKFKVLIRLAKVIRKYGKRVLNFLGCIGWKTALNCAAQIEYCAMTAGKLPWICSQAVKCIGKAAKKCA